MMRPSNPVAFVAAAFIGCSQAHPARVAMAPTTTRPNAPPLASSAPSDPDAEAPLNTPGGGEPPPASFRSCRTDSDCVAVPRVGCCHNGWNESVSTAQKEAYLRSFACPDVHPICAMFMVRDTREPRCDPSVHLCTLATLAPK